MLIPRQITQAMQQWAKREHHKPLMLRGARQVGKTFAIRQFAQDNFKTFIELNLEREAHKKFFHEVGATKEIIRAIELEFNTSLTPGSSILFIDEIQESKAALKQLRYFWEDLPKLHVICAGSFLEARLKNSEFSFPVGRIENLYMHPVTFSEFLEAGDYTSALTLIKNYESGSRISEQENAIMLKHFKEYVAIGGMPEIVASYFRSDKDILSCLKLLTDLKLSLQNDIYKYASQVQAEYLRHVIEYAPAYAGKDIVYEKFAGSSYKSREISQAFTLLEQVHLLKRIYPVNTFQIPITKNLRRRPKLAFLDSGFVSSALDATSSLIRELDINTLFKGQFAEQVVMQALIAQGQQEPKDLAFWSRAEAGYTAEVDLVIQHKDRQIPLEVKSGSSGKLRSLQQYMRLSNARQAICINSFPPRTEQVDGIAKYELTFLPFYLLDEFPRILEFL